MKTSKKLIIGIVSIVIIILGLSFVIPVHNKVISKSTVQVEQPYPRTISSATVTLDYKGSQEDWDTDNINYGKIKNWTVYFFPDDINDDIGKAQDLWLDKHILEDRKPLLPIYEYYPYTKHTYEVIRKQHKTLWGYTWYTRTNTNHNTSKIVKNYDDYLEIDVMVDGSYKGEDWNNMYIFRANGKDQYVLDQNY